MLPQEEEHKRKDEAETDGESEGDDRHMQGKVFSRGDHPNRFHLPWLRAGCCALRISCESDDASIALHLLNTLNERIQRMRIICTKKIKMRSPLNNLRGARLPRIWQDR